MLGGERASWRRVVGCRHAQRRDLRLWVADRTELQATVLMPDGHSYRGVRLPRLEGCELVLAGQVLLAEGGHGFLGRCQVAVRSLTEGLRVADGQAGHRDSSAL